MIRKSLITFIISMFVMAVGAIGVSAQDGWVRVGEKDVDFSVDHDHIAVEDKGHIRELRMSVKYAPIRFDRIVIHYKSGADQEVPFANLVEVDQFSPSVTLTGDGRLIKDVDIWYSTEGMTGKKAKVTFYGRSGMGMGPRTDGDRGRPDNAGWRRLAEKDVDFSVDHDHIVADNKGNVREIRFAVHYAPVRFDRIVIHYKNGTRQEVPFANLVDVDQFSPSVTLEGNGSIIEDLDIWYSTEGMSGKKAKITFYGR